ncbi:type II secretion system F family protein [Chloroflexales bacterium ZM16-3]|nr:type II secretion system F family protein [Chloroflexales bacterium ZM16-3]
MDTLTLAILISVMAGGSVLLVVWGLVQSRRRPALSDRLERYLGDERPSADLFQEIELSRPFIDRVIFPLLRRMARLFSWMWPETRLRASQQLLLMSGARGLGIVEFLGLRLICGVSLLGVGVLYCWLAEFPLSFVNIMMLGVVAFCGFSLPKFWITRRITRRQGQITNALPDALDMLTITIEAGLSFESSLQEIMARWDNDLSREFARVLRDIGMGQSRRASLNGLGERTGVPDILSFVTALNQADELGVSIGRVLKTQSEDMRVRRRQRAHEKANQAPVKIMFPLVFLIFPAIFAVLLGPAVPQLLNMGV